VLAYTQSTSGPFRVTAVASSGRRKKGKKRMENDLLIVSVRVRREQKALLDALAIGSSRTTVLRQAVAMYLDARPAERRRQFEEALPRFLAHLSIIASAARRAELTCKTLDQPTTAKLNMLIDRLNVTLDECERRAEL
jgi:hypothetical protein